MAPAVMSTRDQPNELGPFTITRELARGGMSVVYLAANPMTGEPVALKTVRAPDEVYLASLRREIHALSRLRHPGIVRIVAEGVSSGVPWYAMELLVGETLADVHARIWSRPTTSGTSTDRTDHSDRTTVEIVHRNVDGDTPIPPTVSARAAAGHLQRVLTLVRRMCSPLAFLHGEGIVHCDLKPHNVFIRPGDLPVLVDFGLAWRAAGVLGREVAEVVTKVAGTPIYMAPEQIRLQTIDPRTDLYALGCVLYELVTSQPPFPGGADVLVRHLTREPTAPSQLVDGVPPELDRLILGLLAKRPRERVGYAEDVIAVLERLGAEPEPFTTSARPRPWLYRPELSGREAILQQVLSIVERPRYGSGSFVVLGGESGIGKTYLATEIARRAGSELKVIASSCAPRGALRRGGGELEPFQELFSAIADRCMALGAEATDRILGPRAKVLAPYAPYLLRLPGVAEQPEPPELSGAAAREHLFSALRDTLAELAHEQPLLLLLDDLQWADELGLAFLASIPDRWLDENPVSILATYRSEERPDAIATILGRRDVTHFTIGRLDETTVREVVRDMLAIDTPPAAFVRFLARQSEGNPFFVAEYLRTAVAEGVLRRASIEHLSIGPEGRDISSGVFETLAVPRTIRELIARRLQGLTAPARLLCEVASVIGRGFDAVTLQQAASVSDVEAMEGIAELIARQVIEVESGGSFRFVHDKLREVAYDDLPGERRVALHQVVAIAIEARASDEAAAALAHHWSVAGVDDKALYWLERAAFRSLERAAYREATDFFQRALATRVAMTPQRRGRLESGVARAAIASGDLDLLETHAHRALSSFGRPLPASASGWALLLGRELLTQVAHLGGVSRRAADESERTVLRDAAITAGLMTQKFFYADDAVGLLSTALLSVNLAERASSESHVTRPLALVGFAAGVVGRERLANTYFRRAREGASHDPVDLAFALAVEGVHHCGFGRWSTAELTIARGEEVVAGVHDPFMAELLLTARAHVEFFTGRVVLAEQRFEELLRSARTRQSEQHETWALFSIARSKVARGLYEEARPLLVAARDALSQRRELQSEIICHGLLAETEAALGLRDDARASADATRERIARSRPAGFAASEGYRGAIAAYFTLGDDRGAEQIIHALRKFTRAFPMARSTLLLSEGELHRRRGAERRARRAFEQACEHARAMAMPREEQAALRAAHR